MLPRNTVSDILDCAERRTPISSNETWSPGISADYSDIIFGESSAAIHRTLLWRASPTELSIGYVFLLCSKSQMIWVDATSIIAVVKNTQTITRATIQFPRDYMSAHHVAGREIELPVALGSGCAKPKPASGVGLGNILAFKTF